MAYHRSEAPINVPSGSDLTRALAGIGMRFACKPIKNLPIEDLLFAASAEAISSSDWRLLSVLTTWLDVHNHWVNADRLYRAIKSSGTDLVYPYWAAVGEWLGKDRRFKKLGSLYNGPRVDLQKVGSDFRIARDGEDPRFEGTSLRVPAKLLRNRARDVLPPCEVVRLHSTYKHRVIQGPSYRADMWAALKRCPALSAAALARLTYGSFATAWRVKKDWELLSAAA